MSLYPLFVLPSCSSYIHAFQLELETVHYHPQPPPPPPPSSTKKRIIQSLYHIQITLPALDSRGSVGSVGCCKRIVLRRRLLQSFRQSIPVRMRSRGPTEFPFALLASWAQALLASTETY